MIGQDFCLDIHENLVQRNLGSKRKSANISNVFKWMMWLINFYGLE